MRWTITAETTSRAVPWPSAMYQKAAVRTASPAVKSSLLTRVVVAGEGAGGSPSGCKPEGSGRWRTRPERGSATRRMRTPDANAVQRQPIPRHGQSHELGEEPTNRHARGADAQREGTAAPEPGHDRHPDGQVATQARSHRHQKEGEEEHHRRADLAEEHEA